MNKETIRWLLYNLEKAFNFLILILTIIIIYIAVITFLENTLS